MLKKLKNWENIREKLREVAEWELKKNKELWES